MDVLEYLKQQQIRMGQEAQELANHRLQLDQAMQETNMRLQHLAGAISEVDKMVKSLENEDLETPDVG